MRDGHEGQARLDARRAERGRKRLLFDGGQFGVGARTGRALERTDRVTHSSIGFWCLGAPQLWHGIDLGHFVTRSSGSLAVRLAVPQRRHELRHRRSIENHGDTAHPRDRRWSDRPIKYKI